MFTCTDINYFHILLLNTTLELIVVLLLYSCGHTKCLLKFTLRNILSLHVARHLVMELVTDTSDRIPHFCMEIEKSHTHTQEIRNHYLYKW